jgi:hypothetical protein
MNNNISEIIRIQKWYRFHRSRKTNWWPIDSNTGSGWAYNKWLNNPQLNTPKKQNHRCFNCVIF